MRHAVQTYDRYVNQALGTNYPALILHEQQAYTRKDMESVRTVVSRSTRIIFKTVELGPPPGLTREQCMHWVNKTKVNGEGIAKNKPLGYRRMCREWTGPFQNLPELSEYKYYMRMDDDSFFVREVPFDPFKMMQKKKLTYAYKSLFTDARKASKLWEITLRHFGVKPENENKNKGIEKEKGWKKNANTGTIPRAVFKTLQMFGKDGTDTYNGVAPYNNFHVSSVDFWRTKQWAQYFQVLDQPLENVFMKHCVGDANVHALAMGLFMRYNEIALWPDFPVKHNANEAHYPPKAWGKACQNFDKSAFNTRGD